MGTQWTAPLLCIWEYSQVSLTQVVTPDRETEAVPLRMTVTEVKDLQGQPKMESCLLTLFSASFSRGPRLHPHPGLGIGGISEDIAALVLW